MRVTQHSGRTHRNGKTYSTKHNDRNFQAKASNIDPSKTADNDVWTWCQDIRPDLTIDEAEHQYYKTAYQKQLDATNAKYEKARHKERVKTIDEWRKQKKHAPEEVILQIGRMEEKPDIQVFKKCFQEYLKELNRWNMHHGNCMHILDWALHQDELGAPHVHLRRVWDYYDIKTKMTMLGQEKALEAAGVPLPEPDKPIGHYNNRKMTFDSEMRTIWQNIAKEYGLEIETVPLPKNEVGMDLDQKIRQKEEKRKQQEKELQKAQELFQENVEQTKKYFEQQNQAIQEFNDSYNEKIEQIQGWETAADVIENTNPDTWVDQQFQDCFEKKISTQALISRIKDGVKGYIAKVKKSYDEQLHGYRKIMNHPNGQTVCQYSYGSADFKDMLLDTPIDEIQNAINECRQSGKRTFGEYLNEPKGLRFFEKYFNKAKELKREIERTLTKSRGHSR